MAKGPKGEKRPADLNRRAFDIVRIASGEAQEEPVATRGKRSRGGAARAATLTPEQRAEIAKVAATARWKKGK